MTFESRSSRVSFFGRFADELTRADVSKGDFQVALNGSSRKAQYKDHGYFVFADLRPSPPAYALEVISPLYRNKAISGVLPANTMVELTSPGEDELIVISTTIDLPQNRVNFGNISFLPSVAEGAAVRGPGAFSATLPEVLEGNDVAFARLSTVAGLNNGDTLRFVRSTRMLLRPGPYYQFPSGSTLLALTVVENTLGSEPVSDAQIQITHVNTLPVSTIVVGGMSLNRVDLPGVPPIPVMLGPAEAITTRSNSRGHAIFYYPQNSPITALRVTVTKAGYVNTTVTAAVTPGQRAQQTIPLPRV